MMAHKWLMAAAAATLAAGTGMSGCGTTVRPGHVGLKYIAFDEPALEKKQRPDGFYWQWPWNDIITYDMRFQTRDENVKVLTADDLHVESTVSATFRPHPKQAYRLHTMIGPNYYQRVIRPLFMTLVRAEFAGHKHNDLARHSPLIEQRVLQRLREQLKGMPLEIGHISIKHMEFDPVVTRSISKKLTMEQQAMQKTFELEIAKRDADIARTAAQGQGDAIRIKAEGEAQAIVLKGKGQAQAQEAITETLTPKYLQYKAFDSDSTRYYFVPVGKNGMPLIINAGTADHHQRVWRR